MQNKAKTSEPSQRQLRVGEEIRHALAGTFMRGDAFIPSLETSTITVSEVRISPDLKHATAYVTRLGGQQVDELVILLNEHAGELRHHVTRQVPHLKFSPKLLFRKDESFDEAQKINDLLRDPRVQRDLAEDTGRERDA